MTITARITSRTTNCTNANASNRRIAHTPSHTLACAKARAITRNVAGTSARTFAHTKQRAVIHTTTDTTNRRVVHSFARTLTRAIIPATAALALAGCHTVKYDDFAEFRAKEYGELSQFEGWLSSQGLLGVVPTEGLVRSATDWRQCKGQPWGVPPAAYWPAIAPTLNLIKHRIVPLVGPVEVQSGWRSPELNACVGGSSGSKHMSYQALDLTPLSAIDRKELLDRLCLFWSQEGEQWKMGLGTYDGVRFHIDTAGWRTWGPDYSARTSACLDRGEPPAPLPLPAEGDMPAPPPIS